MGKTYKKIEIMVGGNQHEKQPVGDIKSKKKYKSKRSENNGSLIMRWWARFKNRLFNK